MKKFAILLIGVALLTSGSGCCWWGWPFGGYGYGYNSQYGGYGGYGSPNCPGGNCGVPGTTVPLGIPSSGFYPNSTSIMQSVVPGPVSAPITVGLPAQIYPAMPQTAMRYIEPLPTY